MSVNKLQTSKEVKMVKRLLILVALVFASTASFANTNQTNSDSIPTNGLVAYYPFNGNANDESGNGHDGVVHGANLTADRWGNAGHAFKFNGLSDYIDIGEFGEINDVSISMWFRSDTSYQNAKPFGSSTNIAPYDNHIFSVTFVFNNINSTFYYLLSTRTGPDNELYGYVDGIPNDQNWHHFVFTRTGNSVAFFLDCEQRSITVVHGDNTQSVNTHKSYFLGADNSDDPPLNCYFNGALDDIRIYNRALTEAEARALYGSCTSIPTLTEWGMIIFGVVLLGFITWVFLKKRKVIGVR
jgi:hypothetical protein